MKTSSSIALCSLLALAAAVPVKRDIVWVTVIEEVIETVNFIETVWVDAGGIPMPVTPAPATPTTTAPLEDYQSPPSSSATSSAVVIAPAPIAPIAAPAPQAPTYSSFSTSTTTPPSSPPSNAPIAQAPAPVSIAPVPVSSPPSPPSPPAYTPPASPASSPPSDSKYPSGSMLPGATTSWQCESGSPCSGSITYYSPSIGVGACGNNPDSSDGAYPDTYPAVAIAVDMMGSLSSGDVINPLCGKTVHITNPANGKTATGMVVDKCYGCKSTTSIDLSPTLFDQLADQVDGHAAIDWYFD
ncbi:hypothetical protein MMC24_003391 [Lignoscripta atroalba]|nr:hypothetical protein [Lignoscripta atroalba]